MLSGRREFVKSGPLERVSGRNSDWTWVESVTWKLRKSRFGDGKPQTASNQLGQAKAMVQECCGRMAVQVV
jgi:hypothetical protein